MIQIKIPVDLRKIIEISDEIYTFIEIMNQIDLMKYVEIKESNIGRPRFDVIKLLKIILFAFMEEGCASTRRIEKLCKTDVRYIWILDGMKAPSHMTIDNFINNCLKKNIDEIFAEINTYIFEKENVDLGHIYIDGTKIEANANKYTFVWNKSVKNYDKKLDEKIKNHLREIDRVVAEENRIYLDEDLEELGENNRITSEQVEAVVESIDARLAETPDNKELKKKAKEFKKDILPRKKKYEEALHTFEGRNSYSKTDHDATFMRMKEDAMLNGQLKPGYNVQIGTENRYIVGYTIHPNPTDTKTMIPHLNHLKEKLGTLPENIITDSGYGSEENYEYLEENHLGSYVKYNKFHWEKKKKN